MNSRLPLSLLAALALFSAADLYADVPTGGKNQWNIPGDAQLDARAELLEKVRTLASQSDFQGLEQLKSKLTKERQRFSDGEPKVYGYYESLAQCSAEDQNCSLLIQRWKNSSPEESTPYTLEGLLKLRETWKIRGGGFVGGKSEDTLLEAQAKLDEAATALKNGLKKQNADPHLYNLSLEAAAMEGAPDQVLESLLQKGTALDPLYFPIYRNCANFLRPEWGRKRGLVEAFAERKAEATKAELGDGVYAIVALSIMDFSKDRFFSRYRFSWKRMKQGFQDLSKKYPETEWYTAKMLDTAFYANDPKTVRDELARQNGKLDRRIVERNPASVQALIDWAQGKADYQLPPLHKAILSGDAGKVKELLAKKIDVNQVAFDGSTALILAAERHREFVPLLLKQKASPMAGDYHGRLPLEIAVINGDRETALLLLQAGGFSPHALEAAIKEDKLELIQDILRLAKDADSNVGDENPFRTAIDRDRFEAAKLLLQDQRFTSKYLSREGEPPLHYAVRKGKAGFVRLFLEAKSDPNLIVPGVGTAFDIARGEHPELLSLLTENSKDDSESIRTKLASSIPSLYRRQVGQPRIAEDSFGDGWVRLKLDGKWAELQEEKKKVDEIQVERIDVRPRLEQFYNYMIFCPDALSLCAKQMDAWAQTNPSSAVPLTALIMVELQKIEALASDSNANLAAEKRERLWAESANRAWVLFEKAVRLPDADAQTYTSGIRTAAHLKRDVPSIIKLIEAGERKRKDYWPLWSASALGMIELQDQKGLEQVVQMTVHATEEKIGKGYYSRLASMVENRLRSVEATNALFSWELVKTGFLDLSRAQPDEKFFSTQSLMMSYRRGDRAAARSALSRLGNACPQEFSMWTGLTPDDFITMVMTMNSDRIGERPLTDAVKKGDKQGVLDALAQGALLEETDTNGQHALRLAILHHPELVPTLLEKGVRPAFNGPNSGFDPNLMIEKNQLENLQALLNTEFDPTVMTEDGSLLTTALLNRNKKAAELILASPKFLPGTAGFKGKTDIDVAIETKQYDILDSIVKSPQFRIDTPLAYSRSQTPIPPSLAISRAILSGDKEAIRIVLRAKPNLQMRDLSGKSPLELAQEKKDLSIVAMLTDPTMSVDMAALERVEVSPLISEESPIVDALRSGDLGAVESAVRGRYSQPSSPMMAQTQEVTLDPSKGYSAVHVAATLKRPDLLTVLLKYGPYRGTFGFGKGEFMSPLLLAVKQGDLESSRVLLASGDRPDSQYKSGETPYLTAKIQKKQEFLDLFATYAKIGGLKINEVGAFLRDPEIEAQQRADGAVIENFCSQNGLTPLDSMGQKGLQKAIQTHQHEVVRILLSRYGSNVNSVRVSENFPLPLITALEVEDPILIGMLLKAGANPRLRVANRESPLEFAQKGRGRMFLNMLEEAQPWKEVVDSLNMMDSDATAAVMKDDLETLAAILRNRREITSEQGMTALHYAVKYKRPKAVELLLQSPNYTVSNILNRESDKVPSLLKLAVLSGQSEILKMLLASGVRADFGGSGSESPIAYVQRKNLRELLEPMEANLKNYHRKLAPDGVVLDDTPS